MRSKTEPRRGRQFEGAYLTNGATSDPPVRRLSFAAMSPTSTSYTRRFKYSRPILRGRRSVAMPPRSSRFGRQPRVPARYTDSSIRDEEEYPLALPSSRCVPESPSHGPKKTLSGHWLVLYASQAFSSSTATSRAHSIY